jgi:hypothetical protein
MTLGVSLTAAGEPALAEAQVAFHLHAGADLVITAVADADEVLREVFAPYGDTGLLRVVRGSRGGDRSAATQTELARLAATEHAADWVINCAAGEFWWPRGASLEDVLAPIPPRYTVVQALRRFFLATDGGNAQPFSERMTSRCAQTSGPSEFRASTSTLLRPVHRGDPDVVVRDDGGVRLGRAVPLRAWYPFEAFQFPASASTSPPPGPEVGAVVTDLRLRDALRTIAAGNGKTGGGARRFVLPGEGKHLSFRTPDIVEDAAYAAECAAVGEVDLPGLERYIEELEQRVAQLERGFWPRVLRVASNVARRRSG